MVKRSEKPIAHFSWPDALVLAGAGILVPVAIYQRHWFFLGLGLAIAGTIGLRVWVTRRLARRARRE